MARYIDADKFIAHLKDEIKECEIPFGSRANGKSIAYGTALGLKSAISFVETLSTADVVPKSEADNLIEVIDNTTQQFLELHDLYQNAKREGERLEHILNCYALQYGTVMDKHTVIEKERAEVAREIFEEICASIAIHAFTSKSEDYANGAYDTIEWVDSKIAELKKKYTEVEE